jgi:putative tricarboxylic transport membrane protein
VTLRSDHVAGAAFVVFGILVFWLAGDLPFGTLSAPGAGMMPKLLIGLMIAFGIGLMLGAASSQPFAAIDWSDAVHAILVVVISAAAIASYQQLGFLITMSLLVFVLLVVIERQPVHYAAAYALVLTLLAYGLFAKALKSPLEQGILGF